MNIDLFAILAVQKGMERSEFKGKLNSFVVSRIERLQKQAKEIGVGEVVDSLKDEEKLSDMFNDSDWRNLKDNIQKNLR